MSTLTIDYEITTPCREWRGRVNEKGYGIRNSPRFSSRRAHRQIMEMVHGREVIAGKVVMHLCDNRRCFRYDHLRIGTQADNNRDAAAKGRRASTKGEANGASKITNDDVPEIRSALARGEAQRVIADRYGVRQSAISNIATGKHWSHVR